MVVPSNRRSKPADVAEPSKDVGRPALLLDSGARLATRTTFALLLLLLGLWMARDFITPVVWAAVIAITTWPLYERFAALISKRDSTVVAPLLFTLLVGIIIFIPIALAANELGRESERMMQWVTQLRENGIPVPGWIAQMPLAGQYAAEWWRTNLADPQAAGTLLGGFNKDTAGAWTSALGGQLLHRLFHFFFALIVLFFLLRDGPWIAGRVLDTADRLLGDPGERLAGKMIEAVRGTVNGTVVVAVVEGALIGVAYLIAGVPNPVVFALLTAAFAMLPFGAWVAFTAASLLLLAQGGSALAAGGVFGFGAAVMLIGDHFVWPTIVGGAARLPFLLALIGIFGGLQTFGLLGLFVGPVIMAALITIWREWIVASRPAVERSNR
jgi:predicted PurR-regulated permease PerM